ncbi:MAG: hypothetical protein Kow0068_01200 [Marinilabiliales bacterium]
MIDVIAKNPPTGGAALGSIFGLLIANILLGGILLSLLFSLKDKLSVNGKNSKIIKVINIVFMSFIIPNLLWFTYVVVGFIDDNLLFIGLIMLFRLSYVMHGSITLANLIILGFTIYSLINGIQGF